MNKRKRNVYWFFRSLKISGVIVFCVLVLLLGFAECYVKMQEVITGKHMEILEIRDNTVYLFGKEL